MNKAEHHDIPEIGGTLAPAVRIARTLVCVRQQYRDAVAASLLRLSSQSRFTLPPDVEQHQQQAMEIIATLEMLEHLPLDQKDEGAEWFGRLIGEALLGLKADFPYMPKELLDEIWTLMERLRAKFPLLHQASLTRFTLHESDDMHYPYGKKRLELGECMRVTSLDDRIDIEKEVAGKRVAVIIPFFLSEHEKFAERLKTFEQGLKRLQAQTHKNFEVCVFLNKCGWTEEEIRDFARKHHLARVMLSPENVGAAKARNAWIRRLLQEEHGPDFFLFLDDDTYLTDPRCMAKLAYHLQANPEFGGISPQIVHKNPPPGAILDAGYGRYPIS